jgi:hypothetical protein
MVMFEEEWISIGTEKMVIKWIAFIIKCRKNFNDCRRKIHWNYHFKILIRILTEKIVFSEIYSVYWNLITGIMTEPMYCEGIINVYQMVVEDLLSKKMKKKIF